MVLGKKCRCAAGDPTGFLRRSSRHSAVRQSHSSARCGQSGLRHNCGSEACNGCPSGRQVCTGLFRAASAPGGTRAADALGRRRPNSAPRPSQPPWFLHGDFGYSRKRRHFRRLAARSPVSGAGEARLVAEHGAGAPLALKTVAHGDAHWLTFNREVELSAAAGGASGGHGSAPVPGLGPFATMFDDHRTPRPTPMPDALALRSFICRPVDRL